MSDTTDRIRSEMHRAMSTDELYELLKQALEHAQFQESRWAFAHGREQKLRQQVERQTQMITNLENALYGKKK